MSNQFVEPLPSQAGLGQSGGGSLSSLVEGEEGRYRAIPPNDGDDPSLESTTPSSTIDEPPVKKLPDLCTNHSKGVIHCSDLQGTSAEEIQENTTSQGVTFVHRLHKRRNGSYIPTNSFVLYFNTRTLPDTLTVEWLKLPIRQYTDNPRRCRNCQRYGHPQLKCSRKSICYRCGTHHEVAIDSISCTNSPHCANCGQDHVSSYKGCLRYREECAILSLASKNKISIRKAAKQIRNTGTANVAH